MLASISACSDWLGTVDDLQAGSSPAITSTPPLGAVPAMLAWRNTSPDRSTPGPLPYHMPNTPSYLARSNRLICWLPQMAVAARSSFTAGWNLT
ncbi:MAG TPA: hypothetical protein DIW51_02120 [Rhodospirillaceae bacterium]|nr:hypothetical protein [Rhodospirillaceae bacterium]HCS68746.1 hypothetical protein [Rhodospirillaceae bacterium]